jgi:Rrf2 family protein
MSHFGVAVEYALHVLVQLAHLEDQSPSANALAEFQGVPPAYLAKIMTRLEKAALVKAAEGKGGGYQLAKSPEQISFLAVADAVEGRKKLFECTEVRQRCILFGGKPPKPTGICGIHAVMLAAEQRMREQLSGTTVADIAGPLQLKTPQLPGYVQRWFDSHSASPDSNRKSDGGRKRRSTR